MVHFKGSLVYGSNQKISAQKIFQLFVHHLQYFSTTISVARNVPSRQGRLYRYSVCIIVVFPSAPLFLVYLYFPIGRTAIPYFNLWVPELAYNWTTA